MAVKKRGLKRGLDALISDAKSQTESIPQTSNDEKAIADGSLRHLPIEWLQRVAISRVVICHPKHSKSWPNLFASKA